MVMTVRPSIGVDATAMGVTIGAVWAGAASGCSMWSTLRDDGRPPVSTYDPDVDHLRAEARAWFEAAWDPDLTLGEWWSRLAESGWGFPTWPSAWYGRDVPADLAFVVDEERVR